MKTKAILTLLAMTAAMTVHAGSPPEYPPAVPQPRPIERATLYGAGLANMYDTYLSPQEYRGAEFRLMRESTRLTPWAEGRLWRQVRFQGYVNYTHNHADNNNAMGALLTWNYGLHYSFDVAPGLRLLAGGVADLNGGFLWNLRNGNNPASARAYINLAASGAAVWRVRLKKRLLTFRYQIDLPLAGLMFSPHYGQSYYEIFSLGHYDRNVCFTWPGNAPCFSQLLTVDVPIGSGTLRLGYRCDIRQSHVNNLKSHTWSNLFMIGFVKHFRLVKQRDNDSDKLIF